MCMKFYDETKQLYIETDASGVALGAALLQTKSNTNCLRDKVPDNSIFRPIAFSSKSLTGAEKDTSILAILYGLEKFHHYFIVREGKYNHGLQIINCHFQKRHNYIIREDTANPTKNTSIQGENLYQAWTRPIHGRLAVQT